MRNKIVVAAAACVLTAGCDGTTPAPAPDVTSAAAGSPATPTGTSPAAAATTDHDDLKASVQAYSDAYLTGDGKTAYGLLSRRCRKRITPAAFTTIVDFAKQEYGSALPIKTFSAAVSGDLARVTYTYSVKAIDQDSEPWVREDGRWHEDDC
ncbi:hypothetical protein ACQPZX_33580 [Actinoplanes sp. CA-142083]|uniref:hypothetical protein n=1 Tax=Actinoplanes sp. CA-142083 TaxID=3239903 RepID=UPI003D901A3B